MTLNAMQKLTEIAVPTVTVETIVTDGALFVLALNVSLLFLKTIKYYNLVY